MNEIDIIKIMNEATLRLKNTKNQNTTVNEEIKEHLQDDQLFFKISKKNALKILSSAGVCDEKLEETYKKIIGNM